MGENKEMEVPHQFRCPISLDLMKDPVVLSSGITYDRHSIEAWLRLQSSSRNNIKCPVTKQILRRNEELIPNHILRRCIQRWCVRASGSVERMPNSTQTIDAILSEVNSCKTGRSKLKEAIQKLKADLGKECCTRRERIAATKLVASVFCGHCKGAMEKLKESVDVCEEALGTLVMISPIGQETCVFITSSPQALLCITQFLVEGNTKGITNAVLILDELAAADPLCWEKKRASEGLAEGFVQLLRNDEPHTPTPAKAATITTIYHIATEETLREKLVEGGAIALLLETLPLADKIVCEKSLGALDQLCNCAQGRSAAYGHALTVPVIAGKILLVSDLATEFAVSIIWTLCRYSDSPSIALDAIQEGSFEKLLALMQIGCRQKTKEKSFTTA